MIITRPNYRTGERLASLELLYFTTGQLLNERAIV